MPRLDTENEEYDLSFEFGKETEQLLYDKLLAFFLKHQSFTGECIGQSDGPQMAATELICEIADEIFKFDVEWKI